MLKLKLQYFGHLMRRVDSLEKTLMLGGLGGRRRRGRQRMRWLDGITTWWTWVWVNSGRWWWTGRPGVLQFMGSQRVGHNWVTELNWMEVKSIRKKVDKELNSYIVLKEYHLENSLEMLWLGLLAFTAEGPGSIPGGGTKIPQAVQYEQKERKKGTSQRLFLVKECHCALKRSACCPSNIHVSDDMDTKLKTILLT